MNGGIYHMGFSRAADETGPQLEQPVAREMIAEQLLALARRNMSRKRASTPRRILWSHLELVIVKGMEGRIGWPTKLRRATDEDFARYALNCALLLNGMSPSWVPISRGSTVEQIRARKKRLLPGPIHSWMMLVRPNEATRKYITLIEGNWRVN